MNPSVRWNDSLEGYSCKRAVAITTPSRFQAHEIMSQRRWPTDRVRVIWNPISATMLKAGLEFERNGGSEPIVLYTGRLAPVKGIETLLAAAKTVQPDIVILDISMPLLNGIDTAAQLKAAWDVRQRLAKANDERQKLASEEAELRRATEETRANLKALETPLDEGLLGEVLAILAPAKDVEWPSGNWKPVT